MTSIWTATRWPAFRELAHLIEDNPSAAFWSFAALHFALWVFVPLLSHPTWPLDVIEQVAWGKEWQLVFYKHPPLPAWLIELGVQATGNAHWAPYAVAQICVVAGFWAVWSLARMIFDETRALLAVLMLEGVVYHTTATPEFNHNVAQLPFWALTGWLYFRAVSDDRRRDWFLLGLSAAFCVLAKYSAGLLFVPLVLFTLIEPRARARLAGAGPWLAVATACVTLLPHLYALYRIDFLPVGYALARTPNQTASVLVRHAASPLLFMGEQLVAGLGAFVLAGSLMWHRAARTADLPDDFARRYVLTLALGPLAAALAVSAVFGVDLRSKWGAPMFGFAGLGLLLFVGARPDARTLARFAAVWAVVAVAMAASYVGNYRMITPYLNHRLAQQYFPGPAIAAEIERRWREATGGQVLRYVAAGNMRAAANIAAHLDPRPSMYLYGPTESPYIDPAALRRDGMVIVWAEERGGKPPAAIMAQFPQARVQTAIVMPYLTGARLQPAVMGWAIVMPAG